MSGQAKTKFNSENRTDQVTEWVSVLADPSYQNLLKATLIRFLLIYFVPLILLIVFFYAQQREFVRESRLTHLQTIAEHQAYTLDIFLRERIVNLENVIDNPRLSIPPNDNILQTNLDELRKTSDAFVDLGWFNANGDLIAYAGPHPDLESRNYIAEKWFLKLRGSSEQVVITDIYLGFRQTPHFTIAVNRIIDGKYYVLRAVLSPERIQEYLTTLQQDEETVSALLNTEGLYQCVNGRHYSPLTKSRIIPETSSPLGQSRTKVDGKDVYYAWAWLHTTSWVLILEDQDPASLEVFFTSRYGLVFFIIGVILVIVFIVIFYQAKQLVEKQRQTDLHESELSRQLVQASKLATIGELASGIAHEINNPLAIIAEETGLVQDLNTGQFGVKLEKEDLDEHLKIIQDATFRCRDITRKLLGFVRQEEVKLDLHSVNDIIDHVLDNYLNHELELSSIEIIRDYSPHIPEIITDRNQLEQVFLNLIKNAYDAMDGKGILTLHTSSVKSNLIISISDTGTGMSKELLEKIFNPFFTTKEVGKGTGLGLSVSYNIIKSLDGNVYVDSQEGKGSMFVIELPLPEEKRTKNSPIE